MPQTSPAYTPPEILQAGYQAEADGRLEYAVQFYRHLTDYYARTPEGLEARKALQRLNAEPAAKSADQAGSRPLSQALQSEQSKSQPPARPAAAQAPLRPEPAARHEPASQSRQHRVTRRAAAALPRPARGYRLGRALAVLLIICGWLLLVASVSVVGLRLVVQFELIAIGKLPQIAEWLAMAMAAGIPAGLLLVVLGQLALAVFRTANATAGLLAAAQASADHEVSHD